MVTIGLSKDIADQNSQANIISLLDSYYSFVPFDFNINDWGNSQVFLFQGLERNDWCNKAVIYSLPIPLIGMARMSKLEQHIYFRKEGIPHPAFWNTSSSNKFRLAALLKGVAPDTQLIVKSMFRARGAGQFLIKKEELVKLPYRKDTDKGFYSSLRKEKEYVGGSLVDRNHSLPIKEKESASSFEVTFGGNEEDISYSKSFLQSANLDDWLITERVPVKKGIQDYFFLQRRNACL